MNLTLFCTQITLLFTSSKNISLNKRRAIAEGEAESEVSSGLLLKKVEKLKLNLKVKNIYTQNSKHVITQPHAFFIRNLIFKKLI